MPETDLKYRAFLSYSHADTGVALRVHRRLESFHIDKELVGRVTPAGPIPKILHPIFRDRNDFDAGSSLGAETGIALDGSAALVLLASPHAARSKYVNEEVRLFKLRHPDRPVIPLIIDGTPGEAQQRMLSAGLALCDRAGRRRHRHARRRAGGRFARKGRRLRVGARQGGCTVDRACAGRRLSPRRARAAAAGPAAHGNCRGDRAAGYRGGGLFWQSTQQKQTLNEISALVDKYSIVTPAQAAIPGAKQSLTEAITAIAQGAATDPRYAQALALLKAGKPNEAEPLLKAVAEDKERRADKDAKDAAAAYRNLASIAAVSDPGRARDYYARAARLRSLRTLGACIRTAGFRNKQGNSMLRRPLMRA